MPVENYSQYLHSYISFQLFLCTFLLRYDHATNKNMFYYLATSGLAAIVLRTRNSSAFGFANFGTFAEMLGLSSPNPEILSNKF